jgi:non-heme chloroperoxidase
MQFITKYAALSGGVKLPYVERGNAAGVPVIFLHGITDSLRSFDLLLPRLPRSVRAFAVTQRGHGDAARPETGYAAADFAADIAEFMDFVGIKSAVIVGHSMGSFNAQRFAMDYPERVSGLVLIGSFPTCKDNREVLEFVEIVVRPLSDPIPREFAVEFQQSTFAKPIPPEFFETIVNVPARVWKAAFDELKNSDNSDELGKIKAPTLLIWGELDAYFPRGDQEKLLEKINNSELIVYPEVGHAPHWEEPQKVADDIVNFIENSVSEKRAVSRESAFARKILT